LFGVIEIGNTRSAKKASAKNPAANATAIPAIFLAERKPKTAAANSPSAAAKTAEPDPPESGMNQRQGCTTHSRSRQVEGIEAIDALSAAGEQKREREARETSALRFLKIAQRFSAGNP
jgi:hypothetical protein